MGFLFPAQGSIILAERKWPYQMCVWEHNDIAVVSPRNYVNCDLGNLCFEDSSFQGKGKRKDMHEKKLQSCPRD